MSVLDTLICDRSSTGRVARVLLMSTALATTIGMGGRALAADSDILATADQAAPPPAAGASGDGLGEVVVTARKREENLQTTPVTADVVSYSQLQTQNLLNLNDLRGSLPDLTIGGAQGGNGVTISIRGVGAPSGSLVQNDPRIGIYFDDMLIAQAAGNSMMFYDESGLQVLYGPQGTLFGRNTSAGAVLINGVLPSANGSSYMQATIGNYDTLDLEGGINIPLTDTLFTRFSFRTENSAGYITHLLDDLTSDNIDDQSFRGQLRWTPTNKLTVDLLYERDQTRNNGQASIFEGCSDYGYPQSNNSKVSTKSDTSAGYNALYPSTYCSMYSVIPGKNSYEVYGGSLFQGPTSSLSVPGGPGTGGLPVNGGDYNPNEKTPYYRGGPFDAVWVDTFIGRITYDLTPDIQIKSTTTNRQSDERDFSAGANLPVTAYEQYDDDPTKALSQEFNINGKAIGNRLHYVGGFYYYDQTSSSLQFDGTDYCDPDGWNDVEVDVEKSYAVYGQADFDVTPQLQLEVGGRYTDDYKYAYANIIAWEEDSAVAPALGSAACSTFVKAFEGGVAGCANALAASNHASWTNFNPEGAITYKFTPDFTFYVTIRSSYDEGTFNAHSLSNTISNPPPYGEYNGVIGEVQPDHFTDYEGGLKTEWFDHTLRVDVDGYYQKYIGLVSTTVVTVNNILTRQSNNAGDAHYAGFEGQLQWAPTKDIYIGGNGYVITGAYDKIYPNAPTSVSFNLTTPLVGVGLPAYGYSLNGSYTLHPYQAALLTVSMNWKYQAGSLGCEVGTTYTCTTPAYGVLGGRAVFQMAPDSPWTVSAFVTNLLGLYTTSSLAVINTASTGMGIASITPIAPREFGMIIKRTF